MIKLEFDECSVSECFAIAIKKQMKITSLNLILDLILDIASISRNYMIRI
jgi:hypothetical protein